MICPSCARELPGDFPFCPFCGASTADAASGPGREERKIVTVLFADLVGFTARAETLDPEDVRALLAPYHAHLRSELERFGGTVEKFIGDAVMALFGAPVAHEDDPERAVRAALAIRDWAVDQGDELQVRIAVNTGEALVALDARVETGEAMAAGDVVNTAARLQAAAPLNGVLAGEQTYRATAEAIEYRDTEPVTAKGKNEPIRAWEAMQARSRFGTDVSQRGPAPLVGRARELDLLVSTLARAREERSTQLVTLVGVPGIGKSRLVHELFQAVEQDASLVTWRQGRSLSYGDGVTFWALAEIVKAQAGILESDTSEQTEEKIGRAVDRVAADASEAQWLTRHLYPLAGLADDASGSRLEAYAAWRRFLVAMAEERPLVLVFEDLHWADEAMLDFVDQLVERAGAVPMLVLGTARPELLERRPGWGGGKTNALTISLSPLSDDETDDLVQALLESRPVGRPTQKALLARAGGNPLYAEQYTRALLERGAVEELPETVQGIIAARLDGLSDEEKKLLQDAAVIGKVFWLGAVEAVNGFARWQAEELLHTLERKEFVQRARRSSVASESEYAFRHALIRDVAYGLIPRPARSEKHRRTAAWIESLGRSEDQAEMLAHHYLQALELAEAAGLDTSELSDSARSALRDAGDRAAALYAVEAAGRFYDAALRLWPDRDPERAQILLRRAIPAGRHVGGGEVERLEEARDALLEAGDVVHAAEAEMLVAQNYWIQGRPDVFDEHSDCAFALIAGQPPSRSGAWILSRRASRVFLLGETQHSIELGREALALSEQLGWEEGSSDALNLVGMARVTVGDRGGIEDLERSTDLAAKSGALGMLARAYNSLTVAQQILGEPGIGYEFRLQAAEVAQRIGDDALIRWFRLVLADHRYRRGEWDDASREVDDFLAAVEAGSPNILAYQGYGFRAEMRLARGDVPGALADAEASLAAARIVGEIQAVGFALTAGAHVFSRDAPERALEVARELLDLLRSGTLLQFAVINLPLFASAVVRLGLGDEFLDVLCGYPETRWTEAVRAYLTGDFVGAANVLQEIEARPDEAEARLRAGEQLLAQGRPGEANEQLGTALAFYRSVGAVRYVDECEALLAGPG